MAEITLQQIAELMDQKFAAQTAAIDQRFDAMEARMDRMEVRMDRMEARMDRMDQRFESIEERMEQKFAEQAERIENAMIQAIETAVSIITASQEAFKEELREEIIRSGRVLAENIEGRKIETLFEESYAHKVMLEDHEARIMNLETAG